MRLVRVAFLVSKSKKKIDLILEQAKKEYGLSLEDMSDENLKWMIKNGYHIKKRYKRGTRGKRSKNEI